ncbi:MAG TPA: hypothetical protein PLJ38_01045 [bacterium]|nr:hypothetical protein [bacterium]
MIEKKFLLLKEIKEIISVQKTKLDKVEELENLINQEQEKIDELKKIDENLQKNKYIYSKSEREKLIEIIEEINTLKQNIIAEYSVKLEDYKKQEKQLNTSRELANKYYQKPPIMPRFFDTLLK